MCDAAGEAGAVILHAVSKSEGEFDAVLPDGEGPVRMGDGRRIGTFGHCCMLAHVECYFRCCAGVICLPVLVPGSSPGAGESV